jgi:hypothetical protein
MVSQKDMMLNSYNNIACVLIHESFHLKNFNKNLNQNQEEIDAYKYELDFTVKLDDIEFWIQGHAIKMIEFYRERLE